MSPTFFSFDKSLQRYRCSNCRMTQQQLTPRCIFCDAIVSNYEDLELEDFLNRELDKPYEERWSPVQGRP